ncbi:MAG: M13 family metallopeptidase [Dokdonella sp.]
MNNRFGVCAAFLFCASSAVAQGVQQPKDLAVQRVDLESHSVGAWGVDFADQDRNVQPGDNFYEYQNGNWLAHIQFGPNEKAQAYWRDLRLLAPRRIGAILESLAADATASTKTREGKAGAVYRSFMDEKTAEARGVKPLMPSINAIKAANTKSKLAFIMGQIAGPGTIRAPSVIGRPTGWSFFRLDDIKQDRAHPDRYAAYVAAGGLVLPGPEYYFDEQFSKLRAAYVDYIANVLTQLGWPDPKAKAKEILELETQIAHVSWSHEQMLDPVKTFNSMSLAELRELAPGFDWNAFMRGGQLASDQSVVVDAKSAFPAIAKIFAAADLDVLKARQAFGVADQHSDILDSTMLAAAISFRGNALGDGVYLGAAPRRLRAEKGAEATIPGIVSALYVAKYSSSHVKTIAQQMAENMREALDARLRDLSWMSPTSRGKARDGLKKMRILIGYPDRFDDFSALSVDDKDLYGNYARSSAYQWGVLVHRLDKPFDRSLWSVSPEYPTFNYSPTSNTVEIPAALLVPPFFDVNADPAVNYGSAGAIIGAMMASPFFTKQGLNYDADGHLNPWLTQQEEEKFSAIRTRLATQYSKVEQLPGFPLKGELVADEALGDLAGLEISLAGYIASLKGVPAPLLDGYTGNQRFFLGRAQMWRAKFVESFVRSQIATGSNEPPFMRVNGLLPNMDAWYAAFNVMPGAKLYIAPRERVEIW